MDTNTVDIKYQASLSQKVVATLSRIGISSREVREIVDYIRLIKTHGLSEEDLPETKLYIFRELAKDGIIERKKIRGIIFYTG